MQKPIEGLSVWLEKTIVAYQRLMFKLYKAGI
jgi:hypothetical protein